MDLIKQIMSHDMCEVFTYLHWNQLNPYLSDETKWNAIDSAFGGSEWKEVLNLPQIDRPTFMRERYKAGLRDKANTEYTWHIEMRDEHDRLSHWLFFCTNNIRGLEEMKRAMWSVDDSGCFYFSSKDNPDQFNWFKNYSDDDLTSAIRDGLSGQTISVGKIKEFVLTETPSHLFKTSLKAMENEGWLTPVNPPEGRIAWSFKDESMLVTIQ